MYDILTLNKIAKIGLDVLGGNYAVSDDRTNPDGILVRSAAMHDMEFDDNLKAIARAGAGTNNIPVDRCAEEGIVVFNTPGANANAVKELVICGLFLASRDITEGAKWTSTLKNEGEGAAKLVEKGKGQFAGHEIAGKSLALSDLELSALWLLTQLIVLEWKFWDMTHTSQLMQHGAYRVQLCTSTTSTISSHSVTILQSTFRSIQAQNTQSTKILLHFAKTV